MPGTQPFRIKTIGDYHRIMGIAKPAHPLITVLDMATLLQWPDTGIASVTFDFYSISLKKDYAGKMKYGQQAYDFDNGTMFFIAPGQVFGMEGEEYKNTKRSGWLLLIHPDFLWGTGLAKTLKQYEFFDYAVHEALYLSEKEEGIITGLMQSIAREYSENIDKYSQDIIIAHIELLLSYSERFYNRQFITRKIDNHHILARLEELLTNYFDGEEITKKGLPSVAYIAGQLNLSPGYLSAVLRAITGLNTQQHIHEQLIKKAKEKLSITNLSVSEIAYGLGFEHPQSFSKLFKTKTSLSPLDFRQSFN